jgi:transcriptional regulator with GAF, ATPase, and Fis domain
MPFELPGVGLVYDAGELAELLKVSTYTVDRHRRLGLLHGRQVGRRVLFTAQEVAAYLSGNGEPTRRAASPAPTISTPKPAAPRKRSAPVPAVDPAGLFGSLGLLPVPDDQPAAPPKPIDRRAAREPRNTQRRQIEKALTATGGNRAQAAKRLKISSRTLYRKMAELAIDIPSSRNRKG